MSRSIRVVRRCWPSTRKRVPARLSASGAKACCDLLATIRSPLRRNSVCRYRQSRGFRIALCQICARRHFMSFHRDAHHDVFGAFSQVTVGAWHTSNNAHCAVSTLGGGGSRTRVSRALSGTSPSAAGEGLGRPPLTGTLRRPQPRVRCPAGPRGLPGGEPFWMTSGPAERLGPVRTRD